MLSKDSVQERKSYINNQILGFILFRTTIIVENPLVEEVTGA